MYALPVQKLPQGQEWLYEVKFDGYRCLAGRDSIDVTLWSRRNRDVNYVYRDVNYVYFLFLRDRFKTS
jgi:bifunctional non-homologous end joining protein LigD